MAYRKKAEAPASFDLAEAFVALITGDAVWGWLVQWVPLFGQVPVDTASWCEAGPTTLSDFDPLLFLPVVGRTPAQTAINVLARIAYVRNVANDRVFGAYCEEVTEASCRDLGPYHMVGSGGSNYPVVDLVEVGTPYPATVEFTISNIQAGGGNMGVAIFPRIDSTHSADLGLLVDMNVTANGRYSGPWNWPAAHTAFGVNSNGRSGDITVHFCGAGGDVVDYVPTDQPAPVGYVARSPGVYETIADLGAELDRQEIKLDDLLAFVQFLTSSAPITSTPSEDDPIPVVPDEPIPIGTATGLILTLANIPAYADEEFGTPVRLHRVGRVTLGTADGWLPSFDIEHSPMVLLSFPKGVTRVQVNANPPVTASVQLLYPQK